MKEKTNASLALMVLLLAAMCYLSVSQPLRFDTEVERREAAVKERLLQIGRAEEAWRASRGAYTSDFGELIAAGLLADSLQYVPFGGGRRFSLATGMLPGKGGRPLPVMECSASYETFLHDLDARAVARLCDAAAAEGRAGGLKIGDLLTPNNNAGNWE